MQRGTAIPQAADHLLSRPQVHDHCTASIETKVCKELGFELASLSLICTINEISDVVQDLISDRVDWEKRPIIDDLDEIAARGTEDVVRAQISCSSGVSSVRRCIESRKTPLPLPSAASILFRLKSLSVRSVR